MLKQLLQIGWTGPAFGIEIIRPWIEPLVERARGSITSFGTLTLTVELGHPSETCGCGGDNRQPFSATSDISSSLFPTEKLAFSRLCDALDTLMSSPAPEGSDPAGDRSPDDLPQSEDHPYGYRISEPSLIRLLNRAHEGEDPDLLVAEMWIRYEWAEDDAEGDIVDKEDEG